MPCHCASLVVDKHSDVWLQLVLHTSRSTDVVVDKPSDV